MSDNKQFKYNPSIELEQQTREQIFKAVQGPIVEDVLKKSLCYEVKQKLGIEQKVDFYITGSSEVNAFSVASDNEDEPSIVNVNSALFNLMSTDEL